MRRLVISASLAYLIVAFAFTLLTMLNAAEESGLVVMAEADAGVIVAMSLIGIAVTVLLAVRILLDGKRRHELERHVREPRRKSDVARAASLRNTDTNT